MSDQNDNADASPSDISLSNITEGLPGSGDFTETTSRSWFSRIGDSIKAILFGLLLVLVAGVLMFWNEGRSAKTFAALSEGARQVIGINAGTIDPAREGKLVHIAGPTASEAGVLDADFAFAANGLKLSRKVEMYQWKEESHSETQKKLGGGEETVTRYSYTREWADRAIDSSHFRNAADHRNPAMPATASRDFASADAKLGAFTLGPKVIGLLSPAEPFSAPDSALAEARTRLGARARIVQGKVYAGVNADQPSIGDVRISWKVLPLQPVSVVARQMQSTFVPWLAGNGREIILAETGLVPPETMFKHGEDENALLTWILRVVGVVLMFIGFRSMLSLLEVLADVVPFIGNIVGAGASLVALLCTFMVAPLIIAFAWLFYRPLTAIAVLAVGAGLVWGARQLVRRRSAAQPPNARARTTS